MPNQPLKLGLVVVAIFQIVAIFFMLNFYDKLVSNPDNYYKNILVRQDKLNLKAIEDAALPTID